VTMGKLLNLADSVSLLVLTLRIFKELNKITRLSTEH
jgi:hypothetical protein